MHNHERPVATPESTRNNHVRELICDGFTHSLRTSTIAVVIAIITTTRINVAMLLLSCATPSFTKIFVSAAKTADSSAKSSQVGKAMSFSNVTRGPFAFCILHFELLLCSVASGAFAGHKRHRKDVHKMGT